MYKVLIIDDIPSFKMLLELRLKSFLEGLEVTYQSSVTSARDFLRTNKERFDLVILDQHLTDGKGLDLLNEGWFRDLAVLAVSSDQAPEMPGATLKAGATYFLSKSCISEPLFEPLVKGLIERNKLQAQLLQAQLNETIVDTVRTLVSTLRHEINNPLGALLGAAFILRNKDSNDPQQRQTADLVDESGRRIKYVLDELCRAVKVDPLLKADQKVFHIPGDKPWGSNS